VAEDRHQVADDRATGEDSRGVRKLLDGLIARISSTAEQRRDRLHVLEPIGTVPDPEHPEKPVNSL
jgi:hypothetical protein